MAIGPQMLPFTLLLAPVGIYWILGVLGAVDFDFLDIDVDLDVESGVEGGVDGMDGADAGVDAVDGADAGASDVDAGSRSPALGFLAGALRVVNGGEVPVMAVLSILIILMWACAMLGNLWMNPDGASGRASLIAVAALLVAVVLTRIVIQPLKPFFRVLKGSGVEDIPIVGRSGVVRTAEITSENGQVEVETDGESLLLNARLGCQETRLVRGDEVLVYQHDEKKNIYFVRSISNN